MIQIGNDKIKDIYVGSDKIKEVYYGSEKVWGDAPVVIMTSATNAPVLAICYAQGWCANPNYMTEMEASMVSSIGTAFNRASNNTDIKSFDEFQYFTGVTTLDEYTFRYNTGMTSITIPDSVTSIGDYCFVRCTALNSITIPDSVTIIGSRCFQSSPALTSIYILRSTAPGFGISPFGTTSTNYTGRNNYNKGVNRLYVPQGATGYNAGYWLDPLQNTAKCGFTISYTL